jgi:alkylated DNA repair dioxygenase AlkB
MCSITWSLVARQLSMFGGGAPAVECAAVTRHQLDDSCWVDVGPGWLQGADSLFDDLAATLPWKRRSRQMFGEVVPEPRLTSPVPLGDPGLPLVVADIARHLGERYGEDLRYSWANWYRDGDDAVAWHADRIGRSQVNPLVVIVSLGGPRPFRLRPIGGGGSLRFDLASGDLFVMGGACQHRWEHCIPRQRGVGGRISLTYRASSG